MNPSVEAVNPVCPNKPKIPFSATRTFCKQQDNASYLNWRESMNDKINSNLIVISPRSGLPILTGSGEFDGHCCAKMVQSTKQSEKRITDLLINDHTKLLSQSIKQLNDQADRKKQRLADINDQINTKGRQGEDLRNKFEEEQKKNVVRDTKITQLKAKLEELQESSNQSQTMLHLQDEINTWKKRFQDLEKNNKVSQEKLSQLENELNSLKTKQPIQADGTTTNVVTVTKTTKTVKQA